MQKFWAKQKQLAESWHILSLEKYGKTETETGKYDIFSVSRKSLSYFSINTNTENLLAANEVSFCPLVRPSLLVHGEVKFVITASVPLCMSRPCCCFLLYFNERSRYLWSRNRFTDQKLRPRAKGSSRQPALSCVRTFSRKKNLWNSA